jgi:hypothetical protein
MADTPMHIFTHKELARILVKEQNIHEGLWGVYIKFGIGAANVGDPDNGMLLPSAIVPVREIGLQRFDKESNLTVDAAIVNPAGKSGRNVKQRQKQKTRASKNR